MFKIITFKKDDMKRRFMDPLGCPIHAAMKRAGVPVSTVGGDSWYTEAISLDDERQENNFSKKLKAASSILSESAVSSPKVKTMLRQKLIGKSFKVAYLFLFLMVMAGCRVEGVFLDKAYRICRGHNGIQSVNMDTREVACHDGLVKNFRTRARG